MDIKKRKGFWAFSIILALTTFVFVPLIIGCGGGGGGTNPGVPSPSATLSRLEVSPATPSIAFKTSQQFTAMAIYSDNTKKDVTKSVAWSSSDSKVASIDSTGLASALRPGTSEITATDPSTGIKGATSLTVTGAVLKSIQVTPINSSIAKGTLQQLKAVGTFNDGTTQDLTTQVSWSSSNTGYAEVSDDAGTKGLALGKAEGTAVITALHSVKDIRGTTNLIITPAVLKLINVTPGSSSIPKGYNQQFTATGIFSDGTSQNVTNTVSWSSSDAGVTEISDVSGSKGFAVCREIGTTTISAFDPVTKVNGSTDLNVTTAVLESIQVTPSSISIPAGVQQQFTATGLYSDSSTLDLTSAVVWTATPNPDGEAKVSNAPGAYGVAIGTTTGTVSVGAAISSKFSSTSLLINEAKLDFIVISLANTVVLTGMNRQFTAKGHFDDGKNYDLTNNVSWISSKPEVASISSLPESRGASQALNEGWTQISAHHMITGEKATTYLQVSNDISQSRYIVFQSNSDNLTLNDLNGKWDIFLRDRHLGETFLVSANYAGEAGNDDSCRPSVSADGRYVAFDSCASNLVPDDTNGNWDVFIHDLFTNNTVRISVDSLGSQGNGDSYRPSISGDGRYVSFYSFASNLVSQDNNGCRDVFVHDMNTGETKAVSLNNLGQTGNNHSDWPNITPDGRYVSFTSYASDLSVGDTNSALDIFVRDLQAGTTQIASISTAGIQGNNNSTWSCISNNGQRVTFYSSASNLVGNDTNNCIDVFVHDFMTGETIRVSRDNEGQQGNGDSYRPYLSPDGNTVLFSSLADNLVPNDLNGKHDIFLHDCQTGQTRIISINNQGIIGDNDSGGLFQTSISSDGRYITFQSWATNLVDIDRNGPNADIFLFDIQEGIVALQTLSSEGIQGNVEAVHSSNN